MENSRIYTKATDNLRPVEPQYKKGYRYWNPAGSPYQNVSRRDYWTYIFQALGHFFSSKHEPQVVTLDRDKAKQLISDLGNQDGLTWLGHSSFLLKLNGHCIVLDPFLAKRASFSQWVGPKRTTSSPIDFNDIPIIDIIAISHNHYDHCCIDTLKKLPRKTDTQVVVPIGVEKIIKPLGYESIHALDWMDSISFGEIKIQFLPSIHWSKRLLQKTNSTLWGGFRIHSKGKSIYFAGDTAYGEVFRRIGELTGPVDYALLPIGCYTPTSIMKAHHVDPVEAVQIGKDIGAKKLVAMHWGTIRLSHEPCDEPPKIFYDAALKAGYKHEDIIIMKIGETRSI